MSESAESPTQVRRQFRGELILTRLNPGGHREQSRTKIIGSTWAHPAFAGNRVFARSDTELVCVSLEVPSE